MRVIPIGFLLARGLATDPLVASKTQVSRHVVAAHEASHRCLNDYTPPPERSPEGLTLGHATGGPNLSETQTNERSCTISLG